MNQATPASAPSQRFLSVIIPAYNAAQTLGEQLDALKDQEYAGNWEIVVVNNGSTDNTVKMVQRYQQLMPRLRLIHAPAKQNRSYARNIAAGEAKGDALLFCDADDIVAPGWIAALAEAIEKHDIAIGPIEVHILDSDAPRQPFYFRLSLKEPYLNFLPVAMSSNCAVSRQAFEAIGGFSEDFPRQQDVDLSWRLQLHGYDMHLAPEAVVYYRPRETLREVWKQAVGSGEAHVNLYRHFAAHGMPRPTARDVIGRYIGLGRKISRLWGRDPHLRVTWLRKVGVYWGRFRGSLRYRTLYL